MTVWAEGVFRGKTAIVTGGGTGIGKATALLFAQLGADVAVAARNLERVEATAHEVTTMGQRALARQLDIRDPDQVTAFVDDVAREFGHIDFLVNNAGGQFPQLLEEMSVKGWQTVINTNLNGTFYMSQAVGKRMIARGSGGRIVNMATNFVHRGAIGIGHRSAAAAGVVAMGQAMALEWARYNILVNAIGIGIVVTQGAENEMLFVPGVKEKLLDRIPLKRYGSPEDIANLAAYLCSDAGGYITGEVIMVDGGNFIGEGVAFFDV